MGRVPVLIQVVGDSGAGKTLVVERCVRRLTERGLHVAVVKHSHHAPDLRGKDSARAMAAGATAVVFASRTGSFVSFRHAPDDLIAALPVDVVLIEGFARRRFGALRFRVHQPAEVTPVVRQILHAAPRHGQRPAIVVDGRRRAADPVWRFVLGVMAARQAREVRRVR